MIRGQDKAKRAALICAAGGHNLLMVGPPGEGKSLIASALSGILPPLTNQEKVELTRLHSACGLLANSSQTVTRRPMRAVHCTASRNALVGGGRNVPTPGEITLAHLGVLFLDEFPEFARDAIEGLRQPMESGRITIARAEKSLDFPARFTLVAAMNPCPCGHYDTPRCTCRSAEVTRYQRRISGPILDRIDLQVRLAALTNAERFGPGSPGQTAQMQRLVTTARVIQSQRFNGANIAFNAAIPGGRVWDFCNFSSVGFAHFQHTVNINRISSRTMDRLAKVSRTIADLATSERIEPHHITEAASFTVADIFGVI
jgi:magnesium chelatase family protein